MTLPWIFTEGELDHSVEIIKTLLLYLHSTMKEEEKEKSTELGEFAEEKAEKSE